MEIDNKTQFSPEPLLEELVRGYDTSRLRVEVKHARGAQNWTGTYYLGYRLIRVRVNPANSYPCCVRFATGEYTDRYRRGAYQYWSQRLQLVQFGSAEQLIAGGFLHEFSHYLDHQAGRNTRWKQTKADKFALGMVQEHGIGQLVP